MGVKPGLKFFLVDEDQSAINLMAGILKDAGHEVESYRDSSVALSEIVAKKPDCVATSLLMPGIDGLSLCKEIRSRKELTSTKVFVVSSKSVGPDRRRAFEIGADGYLHKPLNSESFLNQINRIIEDTVDVRFWGVRGTLPVPGGHSLRYGGNTSCVTMEFPRGQFFIFDGGSGIKALSDWLLAQQRRHIHGRIFISHPHWDHINALPFFVPLYVEGNKFEFYGSPHGDLSMENLISAQMDGVYFPITIQEFGADVLFHNLGEEEIEVEGITIKTMLLSHPGFCLGYRVEYNGRAICYVTDNELFPANHEFHDPVYLQKLINFVEGADVLITDSTYTDKEYPSKLGWGHSCISEVVDLADRAGVKGLYLFHHDPDQTDEDIDAKYETACDLLAKRNSQTICFAPVAESLIQV